MDLESTYLVVGVLVISAAILLIIDYLFKNKSYEEVVAEQMQQTRALYASQQRPKVKDKKQKKVAKKVKEKKNSSLKDSNTEDVTTDGHETTESQSESVESTKHHVEFKEPVKEVTITKKRVKKEAMRPILVNNKETPTETVQLNSEAAAANHFEESHPKDDFELMSSKEENTKDKKKNKQVAADQDPPKNKKASKHQAPVDPVLKNVDAAEKPEPPVATPAEVPAVTNGVPPPVVVVKEKKKKKHDGGGMALNAGDKQGMTLSELIPLVRKAEMSRVEVQNLIDILLNKQQDAPVIEEWSEGKGDPVQKLKKQLADKEKQIAELQETVVGSQMKLREVRSEQNSERSHLMQTVRELEEAVKLNKMERQSLDSRLQSVTMKCQQLQEQCNDEAMKSRKILDEYSNLKIQSQQMEMHLSQVQEAEVTIAQLRTDLAEMQNRRTMENHAVMEHNLVQVKQLQHQINTYKEDMEKKDCRGRELKEVNSTLESRLTLLLHQEEELKSENSKLMADLQRSVEEMRRLEHNKMQELQMVRSNKDEIEQEHTKLLSDIQKLRSEVTTLKQEKTTADQDHSRLKDELSKLNDSNANLKKENALLREETKNLQDAKVNGLIEDKQQVAQLQSELAAVKSQVQKLEDVHKKEVDDLKAQHTRELDEQRNKNNELRQKNWKVVEALNAAESRVKSVEKQSKVMTSNTQTDELQTKAMFIQRLFANHKELKSLPQEKCEALLKTFIEDYTQKKGDSKEEKKSEESNEVSKLKIQVEDYKKIIEETDSVLSRLQNDVKKAEIRWRNELKDKDNHINRLTEMLSSERKSSNSFSNDEEVCQNDCTNGPETALNDNNGK